MPTYATKPEDRLTESLAACLNDLPLRRAFWEAVAPKRLRSDLPDIPQLFGKLGTSKPDLLFTMNGSPFFYVEAKLDAQTQPLQLVRARSWMRRHGAQDDQLVYLAHHTDTVPAEIGWPTDTLPIRSISWRQVQNALTGVSEIASASGKSALSIFVKLLRALAPPASVRLKSGLQSSLRHDYGRVMHEFLKRRTDLLGDFIYGARIAPRLTYGSKHWNPVFGETDGERIWLFYGPDGTISENYRAQLIIWHKSDIAGSEVVAQQFWREWRAAIAMEPLAEFEWGGRQHADRQRGHPPSVFPNSLVGLVNLPTCRLFGNTAIRLARPDLLRAVQDLVTPLEKIVDRAAASIAST